MLFWQIITVAGIGFWGVLIERPPASGKGDPSLEYPVKAALLVNFAKFTEWPVGSPQAQASEVAICVLGRDPFGDVLEKTAVGRSVGGRAIVIKRYQSVAGARECHVLFVATSETARLALIFDGLTNRPVLTVGESEGFARRGGIIGLVVEDNLARFEVNLQLAQRAGLVLSSKLLGVAHLIEAPSAGHP